MVTGPAPSSRRASWELQHTVQTYDEPPAHHVTQARGAWLPSRAGVAQWLAGAPEDASRYVADASVILTGFRNPWTSWHKPTPLQVWNGLEWQSAPPACAAQPDREPATEDEDEADAQATSEDAELSVATSPLHSWPASMPVDQVRATWIGHATALLELPLGSGQALRILSDPIFSDRCSPTQAFGPLRSLPTPIEIEQLPKIHFVLISHSHYDHLDWTSVQRLFEQNKDIKFLVPLGLKGWFLSAPSPIQEANVYEFDWWDSLTVTAPEVVRFTCTPAQHGSGRTGVDAGMTLWSSWYITYRRAPKPNESGKTFQIFFGGDTGFQFHEPASPAAHPLARRHAEGGNDDEAPLLGEIQDDLEDEDDGGYPQCPAFTEISARLGAPDLNLLPISVGATLSFLKGFDPFPIGYSPFPCGLNEGLTAANHMTPRDAVRCFRLMDQVGRQHAPVSARERPAPIALAIHWGTFVGSENEAETSLLHLRRACTDMHVRFARDCTNDEGPTFVALNPGEAFTVALRPWEEEVQAEPL